MFARITAGAECVAGVESVLWSLLLSWACASLLSVFTAHPLLLLPALTTIGARAPLAAALSIRSCTFKLCCCLSGVICLVLAIMYWLGWEMGQWRPFLCPYEWALRSITVSTWWRHIC